MSAIGTTHKSTYFAAYRSAVKSTLVSTIYVSYISAIVLSNFISNVSTGSKSLQSAHDGPDLLSICSTIVLPK
jgi:hypothetical protein